MTCNVLDSPTSKMSDYALTMDQLHSKIFTFDSLIAYQNDPYNRYTYTNLIQAVEAIPAIHSNWGFDSNGISLYPYLKAKLKSSHITPTDFAQFLATSGLNFDAVMTTTTSTIPVGLTTSLSPEVYLSQLDLYYNKAFPSSETGNFCSAFTGKLMSIFGLFSAGMKLITELKNGVAAFVTQLANINKLLQKLVDKIKKYMLDQIKNITQQVVTVVNSANQFFTNKVHAAQTFFNDVKMNGLKAKIEEIIAGMAGGYEKLTIEIIAYLLYRLCQLGEFIAKFMQSPVDGLKKLLNNFKSQKTALANFSNSSQLNSVNAGAYRMDEFEIARQKSNAAKRINQNGSSSGPDPAYYVSEVYTDAELQTVLSLTDAGNEYVNLSSSVINQDNPIEGAGYKKVQTGVWIKIFRVSSRVGKRLTINSGYRSPAYNAALATTHTGVATNSKHMSGLALDVSVAGFSTAQIVDFIKIASQEGFEGIAYYQSSNFCHVDLGGRRTWNSVGGDIGAAIQMHLADSFRTGRPAPKLLPSTTVV